MSYRDTLTSLSNLQISPYQLGLLFVYGREWMGGVYYLASLLKALDTLPDSERPAVTVLYDEVGEELLSVLKYTDLRLHKLNGYDNRSYAKFVKAILLQQDLWLGTLPEDLGLDGVFPVTNFAGKASPVARAKRIAWYPDLQHRFYPQFFSRINRLARDIRIQFMLRRADTLVVSSEDVASHFRKFYPRARRTRLRVLPFVSMIEDFVQPSEAVLREQYGIQGPYFMVSNQFYEHKDHLTLFEAIRRCAAEHPTFQIVCTGVPEDLRNPDYTRRLASAIARVPPGHLKVLGFIPREDQLGLLAHCATIVQPSRFEGWSTIIEDAKSLGKSVLASDIAVHVEQLGATGTYFKVGDADSLAAALARLVVEPLPPPVQAHTNAERTHAYAQNFMSILREE